VVFDVVNKAFTNHTYKAIASVLLSKQYSRLPFPVKAQFTLNIFEHKIEIKRYEKDILIKKMIIHPIFFLCELKIFIFGQFCS